MIFGGVYSQKVRKTCVFTSKLDDFRKSDVEHKEWFSDEKKVVKENAQGWFADSKKEYKGPQTIIQTEYHLHLFEKKSKKWIKSLHK